MNSFDQTLLEPGSVKTGSINEERTSFTLDRRGFLKVLGGGLLICLAPHAALSQESGRGGGGHELPKDLSAWLHIDADGKV